MPAYILSIITVMLHPPIETHFTKGVVLAWAVGFVYIGVLESQRTKQKLCSSKHYIEHNIYRTYTIVVHTHFLIHEKEDKMCIVESTARSS
jgi:hypothetical protein